MFSGPCLSPHGTKTWENDKLSQAPGHDFGSCVCGLGCCHVLMMGGSRSQNAVSAAQGFHTIKESLTHQPHKSIYMGSLVKKIDFRVQCK